MLTTENLKGKPIKVNVFTQNKLQTINLKKQNSTLIELLLRMKLPFLWNKRSAVFRFLETGTKQPSGEVCFTPLSDVESETPGKNVKVTTR